MRAIDVTESMVNQVIDSLIQTDNPKSKRKNMSTNYVTTNVDATPRPSEVQIQRDYLESRLQALFYHKDEELEKHFGLRDDKTPETPKEMVQRIKDGKYVLAKNRHGQDMTQEDMEYGLLTRYIFWRDPDKKRDQEGYRAAYNRMKTAKQKAEDQIHIYDPKEGLKAVEEFEKQTFH